MPASAPVVVPNPAGAAEWIEVETGAGGADDETAGTPPQHAPAVGWEWAGSLEQSFTQLLAWGGWGAAGVAGAGAGAGRDADATEPKREPDVEHQHVSRLRGAAASGWPLLVALPHARAHAEHEAVLLEVAAAFRGSGLRVICAQGTDEEVQGAVGEGLPDGGLVAEGAALVIFSFRHGIPKVCSYCGEPSSFEALAYFCASVLHSDHLLGAGAFLRKEGFVRYLCPDSMLEVVGSGSSKGAVLPLAHVSTGSTGMSPWECWARAAAEADPPCVILVTRTTLPPEWFVQVSRIFAPRIRSSPAPGLLHAVPVHVRAPASTLAEGWQESAEKHQAKMPSSRAWGMPSRRAWGMPSSGMRPIPSPPLPDTFR